MLTIKPQPLRFHRCKYRTVVNTQTFGIFLSNHVGLFFKVDFSKAAKISAVGVQGVPSRGQWLKKFKVGYSQDGGFFTVYTEGGKEKVRMNYFCFISVFILATLLFILITCHLKERTLKLPPSAALDDKHQRRCCS